MALTPARSRSHRGRLPVKNGVRFLTLGGRVHWGLNDLIAFDYLAPGAGYYEIRSIAPDGSGLVDLTAGKGGRPARHVGTPEWFPGVTHIVFTAVDDEYAGDLDLAWPGIGRGNSIWVMDAAGDTYWHIYDRAGVGALLHPHFSPNGALLVWTETVNPDSYAEWYLCFAGFTLTPAPAIGAVTRVQPLGAVWYEAMSVNSTGALIQFCGHYTYDPITQARADQYLYNRVSTVTTRLTARPDVWQEHAHLDHTNNDRISLACSAGTGGLWPSNLWVRTLSTGQERQLTRFDKRQRAEYAGDDASATDHAWSPTADRIAVRVKRGDDGIRDRIYIVTL